MRVPIQETPRELRRRVADKLESVRGTKMEPGATAARLGDSACPVYRPDIKGVAYWEFEIAGLKGVRSRRPEGRSSGVGFILAATAGHDLPIPHWSLAVEPPSRALESMTPDGVVAKVIKLDTLAYVSEDVTGKYLAHLGQFPPQIVGTATDYNKLRGISTVSAEPPKPSKDDRAPGELVVTASGAKVSKIKLAQWKSWSLAKRGYAKSYRHLLDALAGRAEPAWHTEKLLAEFGEGVLEGQRLTVPLLQAGKVKISGDGAKLVKLTVLDRQPPAVTLEALPSEEKQEVSFQLDFTYQDRTTETLLFFVVPKGTPSNNRSVLPHFARTPDGGITP